MQSCRSLSMFIFGKSKKLRYAEHLCNTGENFQGYDHGTYSQLLVERCYPQDVVVFLKTLSPEFNRYGRAKSRAKSSLDKHFHPAKIPSDLPALNVG